MELQKNKFNIDTLRMNQKYVKEMQRMEKKVKHTAKNCLNCIYRDNEIGHCYYTMTTNKPHSMKMSECSHFVDKGEYLEKVFGEQYKNSISTDSKSRSTMKNRGSSSEKLIIQ